ncbi:hypothetical protein GH741_00685 [Aquibacillus halophilus]|uniref:Uncharacterized protein n=1 Tax=Aquibacillus halophilus TaxID=930132 RepID=A0A6A8DE44_9BACI|nr:hypothetical protein [Aquibacillus halophilus]MRH41187.1 hypothetical protein [Aquibacillus halophilus]
MKELILIDDISSISESVFSFKYKGNVLKKEPFTYKKKREKDGESPYHLDAADLAKVTKYFPQIFPYSKDRPYGKLKYLTKNQYIDLIKYEFYQLALDGKLTNLLECAHDQTYTKFDINWEKNKPVNKPLFYQLY